ncbi:hypothetical protein Pmar_PMAR001729 [Perkinsus marinus ATCC 50983]|uniref:Uncharacterized protein n=1 Tax=Perkinsus marinus (strain ATCC 50983 / TXsc) TaxID=423536 RepID=C5KZ16_PERM5|nr:hypothetical protein Pmar_PMAR001729 [Perkinsus marinus ATCC 50983]EER10280.1 hypothetical protein Pmar_PMAR001729 [Perkinsus marinus ATCC 50983]|eukprot:XP_002778485.1 hypothetical protein Pmar_PMAR001729 [Perkinsus marinus ATCC 50983]
MCCHFTRFADCTAQCCDLYDLNDKRFCKRPFRYPTNFMPIIKDVPKDQVPVGLENAEGRFSSSHRSSEGR